METVIYGNGIVTRQKILDLIGGRKHLVVVDAAVHERYGDVFEGLNVRKTPAGEEVKSIGVFAELVSACNISYLSRTGVIVAVGGGATLDAAGFLASTYMRGVAVIKIPTTVIGMCDAAIGGKTAINSLSAKNEIGTFYEAESILIDIGFLHTLPERELRSGAGELMKYAIGFAPEMLQTLKQLDYADRDGILALIKQAVLVKQRVVEQDFADRSLRMTLNYGHTLGHAVEFASNYKISHGEAVAIGCYYMTQWAHREGRVSDAEMDLIDRCYAHLGLSKGLPDSLNKNVVFSHVLSDKKMLGSEIRLVKLEAVGRLTVEKTSLDVFYDEVFRGPKKRYTLEEQWVLGIRNSVPSKYGLSRHGNTPQGQSGAEYAEREYPAGVTGADTAGADRSAAQEETVNMSLLGRVMAKYADAERYAVIDLPASKSYAHRYLILAAFAEVPTVIERFDVSDDLYNTINALRAMTGAKFEFREDSMIVIPRSRVESDNAFTETARLRSVAESASKRIEVDCGSSASTARFLIPFSGIGREGVTYFYGSGSLENRPMSSIINILKAQGILSGPVHTRSLPFAVTGQLKPGVFKLPGEVTSQFLSGLLMAAPLMTGRSKIVVTGPQVSRPYVDITLDVMRRMGVNVAADSYKTYVISPAAYAAKGRVVVEKDYSQAAFFIVAETLRQMRGAEFKQILLPGLLGDSLQGDRALLDMLGVQMGAHGEVLRVSEPKTEVNLTHCPDLFPIMTVFFALNGKGGVITGADRVSYKESDRYEAMKLEITRLGGRVARESGKLRIYPTPLVGRTVSAHDDHRVAMSLLVMSLFVRGVKLDSIDCIRKSYPAFLDDLRKLL